MSSLLDFKPVRRPKLLFYKVLRCGVSLATAAALLFVVFSPSTEAAVVREPLDQHTYVLIKNGRSVFLECRAPAGKAEAFFKKYLAEEDDWEIYANKGVVAVPLGRLKGEVQRVALLRLFPQDTVDERGWIHEVTYGDGPEGQETLWNLCEWLTGRGMDYRKVMAANKLQEAHLTSGQQVVIPAELLLKAMREFTPVAEDVMEQLVELSAEELEYGKDDEGPYAAYRLKQGEALYTSVVVRFTDYRDNAPILKVCEAIQKRSGIKDPRSLKPGQLVLIPLDLLSARFKPEGSPERKAYEDVVEEARRLRGQVTSRDLAGIVVVIDPGHGGRDQGAAAARVGLYEDELNYDIACRVKRILAETTQAKVYMTAVDRSCGYSCSEAKRFVHDTDEELLTTPRYKNTDADASANLRAYLANAIFAKETANGTDPRKVVFTSFHCDALYNKQLRGAMVYIPGAAYRKSSEQPARPRRFNYNRYEEANGRRTIVTTEAERRRDEAMSRNFASTLMEQLGEHRVRRHMEGPRIRSVIRQNGGVKYVPAVLRVNKIPTKVLLEVANMTNSVDCTRMADPWWREQVAKAYVAALKEYYKS